MNQSRYWNTNVYDPVRRVEQSFETVKGLLQSGQGGMTDYGVLIKSLKSLDENSAVMQGEADSARSMMSLTDRMESALKKVEDGGMGSDAARMQLAELSRVAVNVAINTYNKKLQRERAILGSFMPASTIDAMLAEIPMPAGAESSEALRALIQPAAQSGGRGAAPRMIYNIQAGRWEQQR